MNRFYVGVLYIVLSAAAFGFMPIFAIYAYHGGFTVMTLLALRFLMAAVLFFLVIGVTKPQWKLSARQLLSLLLMGSVVYAAQSFTYFSAVKFIPASLAALLLYTFPIYVTILAYFVEKEPLSKETVLAILLSLGGLVMILGTSFGQVNLTGVLLALTAAIIYALYILAGNRLVKNIPPVIATAFICLGASVSFFIVGAFTGQLQFNILPQGWWALIGIVMISTVVSIFTFFKGLELIGSTKSSILSTVEPFVTVLLSTLLLHEHLTWLQLIGGITVLAGAMLVVTSRSKQQAVSKEVQNGA
ncbi:DMT family transporter [Brevibacillus ginsengisoli]|uniref:DMT family transporter n=1 Tax=Brevibacillus ginsengisoli TaxID=363854 RepID=UPI003CEA88B7